MKKEKIDTAPEPEKPETSTLKKAPKPRKEKKPKAPKTDGVQLPVLVEFTYTISIILLILLGLAMIVISFLTGASLLNLVLRTSVAILVMGSLLMLIASQVSSGVLQASLVEQEEFQKAQGAENPESPATVENQEVAEA